MESLNSVGLVSAILSISSLKLSLTFSPVCMCVCDREIVHRLKLLANSCDL